MKKRTTLIAALVALMPMGQPLIVGMGAVLTSAGVVMLSIPEKVKADSAAFYYNRGRDKFYAGDYYGAISDYNRVIKEYPNHPKIDQVYNNRGNIKEKFEDYYGALADYTKAIEMNPRQINAYYNRGSLKGEYLEDYYGAIADFNKAIEINSNDVSVYNNRGIVKGEYLEDYYGAIADFNKAIEIDPRHLNAYLNRGHAKDALGDLQGACADWREASYLGHQDAAKWVINQC